MSGAIPDTIPEANDDTSFLGRGLMKDADGNGISDMIEMYGGGINPNDNIPTAAAQEEDTSSSAIHQQPTTVQPSSTSSQPPDEKPPGVPTSVPTSTYSNINLPTIVSVAGGRPNNANTPPELMIPTTTSEEQLHQEKGVVGEIFVEFSLYSPNVTNFMDFINTNLGMGVFQSIYALVCADDEDEGTNNPILGKEKGQEEESPKEYVCALRIEVLLKDGLPTPRQDPIVLTGDNIIPTTMAVTSIDVIHKNDIIDGQEIAWTTWRLSYNVLQLGSALRKHIEETEGPDLSEEEVNTKGLVILQKAMDVNMERTLKKGTLEQDLTDLVRKDNIMLIASPVGEEIVSYNPFVTTIPALVPDNHLQGGEELENGKSGLSGAKMIVFFAGLGVWFLFIVAFFYFYLRPQMSKAQRKRTLEILDNQTHSAASSLPSTPPQSDRSFVDTGVTLVQDASPGVQQSQQTQQQEQGPADTTTKQYDSDGQSQPGGGEQQDAASVANNLAGNESEDQDNEDESHHEEDLESQWGRLASISEPDETTSSLYDPNFAMSFGSISALTSPTSVQEQSDVDTWTLNSSMNMDITEWGDENLNPA